MGLYPVGCHYCFIGLVRSMKKRTAYEMDMVSRNRLYTSNLDQLMNGLVKCF
jgi:hypothetical protein